MQSSTQTDLGGTNAKSLGEQSNTSVTTKPKPIRVYLMDMWSIIPFYMGHLCAGLREESVDAVLGSVRYHLDRDYFKRHAISPDPVLLDSGGRIQSKFFRRIVKSGEYLFNLAVLGSRFVFSRPDILHVQFLPFLDQGQSLELWFMRWARFLKVPIVYTAHNVTHQNAPDRYRKQFRTAYHLADAVICHGEEARTQLIEEFQVPAEKIWVIPHGPLFNEKAVLSPREAREKLGLPVNEALVLSLGVISEYKGIPFLLDAWTELVKSGGRGRLVIAGAGDTNLLASIRHKVSENQIESSVDLRLEFISVEQLPLLYEASDILVYPYRAGSTSGALLTGMNYGKAIVATKLPFFTETLREGQNALLIDYGNIEGLKTALMELIANPEERNRLGRAVAKSSEARDSWVTIARATAKCYEAVLKKNPAPARK